MRLESSQVELVVIDIQERLVAAMDPAVAERVIRNVDNLVFLATELGIPVTLTEQYPKGLGPTVAPLRAREPFQKMHFSAASEPGFVDRLTRPHVLLAGMETHICVTLTARELRERGFGVTVVPDACCSRREADAAAGVAAMVAAGACALPSETVLFGLLGVAGTPLFKEISRRIK